MGEGDLGISAACTECYHTVADYGFKNCKAACLLGWCKSGCLSCTQPAQDALPACTGFSPAVAKPCDSVASAGACTADDQSALADAQVVGESQDKCGKKCLSLTGIDHDCFVSCVEGDLGISAACAGRASSMHWLLSSSCDALRQFGCVGESAHQ